MDYYNRRIINNERYLNHFKLDAKCPIIDRTGTLNRQLKVISKLPKKYEGELKFGKIANRRAKNILDKCTKEGRDLRVCYSGGIDSTVALIGLMKYKDKYPDVTLSVLMSQDSIDEYPMFYEEHISGNLDVWMSKDRDLNELIAKKTDKPCYIVTGELGDQLFGSAIMFRNTPRLGVPWEDEFSPDFIEYFKPLMDLNPDPDPSVANALWWLNFTLKYQWVQLRMYVMAKDVLYSDFIHFFGNTKFQQWSMNTPMSAKFPDFNDPASYKKIAKKYILDYTGDKKYFKNKKKKGSLQGTVDIGIGKLLKRVKEDMSIVHKESKVYIEQNDIDGVIEIGVHWK